ncbi:fibronectin type III domain-containing protein [Mariniradius saccharolyticus]|uniref:fibronectin type III domain-containing protein n=1 Tax=Mariniradius saccharolyticus TaxID=1245591 RepID=UPI001B7F82F9|nr:fibronectin type III domain-containing protein [Mariniradius saccharolyticus]
MEGNKLEGKTILEQDQWLGVRLESGDLTEQYLEQLKNKDQNGSLVPFPVPSHIYSKTMTADEAYESVLAAAGASLVRDAVDKRIVQEVKTGTVTFKGSKNGLLGIIDSQNDVGGWPVLQSLPAPKDTDRDGMPDAWETEHGLNPNSYNPNGYNLDQNYTNLEVYLNSLVSHIMEPGNEEIVAVSGVSVDPKTATIDAGKTVQVTATIQPSNASNKQVTWSSSNTAIATVNGSGLVTGIAPGSVVITAKTSDGGFTATSTITVNQTTLPSIVNLVLVDAGDNNDFSVLSNNMVLDNSKIFGKTWNVRANSNPSSIGSVYFSLTGPLVATRTENSAPYALFGDSDGVYQGRELPAGKYVIEAIPYSGSNRSGSVGATYRIEFEIKDLPPSAPALVSPANQALGQELTGMLQWEDVATASNYRVQVSESSSFSTLVVDQGSLMDNQFSYTLPNSGTKYYWRVMARNGTGNSGWSSIWSFTTKTSVQVPGIPVLSAPAKDSSIPVGKTTFSWNTVSGAEKYRLQVSKEAQFNSPTYDVYNLPGTSVELDVKDPGTYYWRVSASNQGGSGAFSTASTFQTIAPPTPPTLVAPNNQSLDLSTSVLLTWAAVSNATSYRVQVATVQDFSQVQRDVSNISSTQLQLDNLSEGVTYYWRVRAGNMAGTSSYSTVWEFSTKRPLTPPAAPVLLTPSSNAVVATGKVLFSWQGVSNANSCRLQVAKDAQFSSPIHDSGNHTNTSIELELLAAGTYFWRVSASNQAGSSPFSAARSFETLNPPSTPQLASPNNQSLDQAISVLLSWSAASNASSYRVQVATVRDFSQVLRDVSNVSATQLQVDNLAEGVTYYWRVRASNPVGNSNYSTTWEFSTKKALTVPATPILSSPSNSSVLKKEPVQMQWQSVATADDYQIQISLSSNFSQQILVNVQGISGTSFQFQDLAYNTVYFWRVRARNAAGFGPYSSIRSFKTEAEPQLAAAILRSPAKNGLIESDQVEFKWSPVPEATSYTLYLSQDSLFKSGQSILRSISDTSLLVSDLQRDKNYFWKIEALGAKKSSFSETWKFAIEKEKETEVFQYRRVDINLYPNPATDFINLSFSEFVSGKVLIQFLDSRGTLVLAREFENVGNELRWDFSGQNIPSGKYFLRIQGEWFVETKQVWIK